MLPDITTRSQIQQLIEAFYSKVLKDDQLAVIFTEIVQLDFQHHIPVIVDFWETVLLNADVYQKNAMQPHFAINQKYPLQKIHF